MKKEYQTVSDEVVDVTALKDGLIEESKYPYVSEYGLTGQRYYLAKGEKASLCRSQRVLGSVKQYK